jgi:hypothetical protein
MLYKNIYTKYNMNFNALIIFIGFNICIVYLLNEHATVSQGGAPDVYFSKQDTIDDLSKTHQEEYQEGKKRYNMKIIQNLIIYTLFIIVSLFINAYIVNNMFDLYKIELTRSTLQNTLMILSSTTVIILIILMGINDSPYKRVNSQDNYSSGIILCTLFFTIGCQLYYFYYNKHKITNLNVLTIYTVVVIPFLYYLNAYVYKNTNNNIIELTGQDNETRRLNMKEEIAHETEKFEKFEIQFSLYVESGQNHINYSYTEILNFGNIGKIREEINFFKLAIDHSKEELVLYIFKDISNTATDLHGIRLDEFLTDESMNLLDTNYLKFTTNINMFYKWNDIKIKYNGSDIYVYINKSLVMRQSYNITKIGDIYIYKFIVGDDRVTSMPGLIKDGLFIKQ